MLSTCNLQCDLVEPNDDADDDDEDQNYDDDDDDDDGDDGDDGDDDEVKISYPQCDLDEPDSKLLLHL